MADKNIGIVSYGCYIPWHRLKREDIAEAWESSGTGEKAVANYDEDSLTMAVEACRNCLREANLNEQVASLFFCSTTPPYVEKQSAATIAEVLQIRKATMTTDITDTLRGGTLGILLALDRVKANPTEVALVCSADKRMGLPNGNNEMFFGDAAAAFCIGSQDVMAVIEGTYSLREEILTTWRSDLDRFVRSYEERFGLEMGYRRIVPEAVSMGLKKYGLTPGDISRAVIYAANPRHLAVMAKDLGFDLRKQIQDTLFSQIGNTGTAQVPINLIGALEQAKAGDRILVANYSDGCDVLILKVTEQIEKARKRNKNLSYYLKNKKMIPYLKYIRWREILPVEAPQRAIPETPSCAALWRDNKGLALIGGKCRECNTVQFPAFRVCIECGAKDNLAPYSLADRRGKIVAFSHDNLAASPDPPITIAVVDFEEGGRLMCDATDRDVAEFKVGMPVEMAFRSLRYVGGIYDYWWKSLPVR